MACLIHRAAAPFAKATYRDHTSHYLPTNQTAGALENRVVPVQARSIQPHA